MWRNICTHHRFSSKNLLNVFLFGTKNVTIKSPVISCENYHAFGKNQNITSTAQAYCLQNRFQFTKQQEIENVYSEQNHNSFTYRTHTCGELKPEHEGQKVTICGWVQFLRLSKFLLLRDAYGITQCIVNEKSVKLDVPLETVVKIEGTVVIRPKNMINPNMSTGEIEVVIDKFEVLNTVDKLPFNIRDYQKAKEQLRLQHRYIDLRFPDMQKILRLRSNMLHNMRRFLVEKHGFVEVETPTLFCRTPGGAREFVVPTHHAGLFYSLVQSPQQLKQMLMSGGVDRYFQIARCYRDETTRPDRQPEFTQLDIEVSFSSQDGVLSLIEQLMYETFPKELPKPPFRRMTYKEALQTYGTDKPNTTYGMELVNIKHLFPKKINDPKFYAYLIPVPKSLGKIPDIVFIKTIDLAKKYITKIVLPEKLNRSFGTYFNEKIQEIVGEDNTCIVAMANTYEEACLTCGELRELIASVLKKKRLLTYNHYMAPVWVVDFPLFLNGENGIETCHHPFTAPHPDDLNLLENEPLKVRSLAYDLVLNGNEIGGGSVRVHNVELQEKLLKILNIEAGSLSHFLNALKSGCPPHAGIALGLDRLVSVACDTESIRDVIAFPKTHEGKDPLSGAPNLISEEDKNYYHIETVK